ncbi:hypothetical protein [Gloeobacter violaceus]|nr:hypothetical protein [Gloeobacter violaceus]
MSTTSHKAAYLQQVIKVLGFASLALSCKVVQQPVYAQSPDPRVPEFCSQVGTDNKLKNQCDDLRRKEIEYLSQQFDAAISAQNKPILPTSGKDVKALEGKTEIEGNAGQIEATILAYSSMELIAQAIRKQIKERASDVKTLIIEDPDVVKSLSNYELLREIGSSLIAAYANIFDSPLVPDKMIEKSFDEMGKGSKKRLYKKSFEGGVDLDLPLSIASSTIRAVADIFSLFKQDITIKPTNISLEDNAREALISQLAADFQQCNESRCTNVYHPSLLLLDLTHYREEFSDKEKMSKNHLDRILRDFVILLAYKQMADSKITELKDNSDLESKQLVRKLTDLGASTNIFLSGLGSTEFAIYSLAKGAKIEDLLKDEGTYLLRLNVINSGGSTQAKQNLFFTSDPAYNGGVAVTYMLFARDGSIRLSDTLYKTSGYLHVTSETTNIYRARKFNAERPMPTAAQTKETEPVSQIP